MLNSNNNNTRGSSSSNNSNNNILVVNMQVGSLQWGSYQITINILNRILIQVRIQVGTHLP